jgi:hypothetical protein
MELSAFLQSAAKYARAISKAFSASITVTPLDFIVAEEEITSDPIKDW